MYTFNSVNEMMIKGKGSQEVAEKIFSAINANKDSELAIMKLADAFHLPMPTGIMIWDSHLRVVVINDRFDLYTAADMVRYKRSVWFWSRYLTARRWPWIMLKRNADNGGTALIFQLPLPKLEAVAVSEVEEVKEAEEVVPDQPPVQVSMKRVVRNRTRKGTKEINLKELEETETEEE
jgi:hypothetical protein